MQDRIQLIRRGVKFEYVLRVRHIDNGTNHYTLMRATRNGFSAPILDFYIRPYGGFIGSGADLKTYRRHFPCR